MSSYTSSSRRRAALITTAVVLAAGQLGYVPVPKRYRVHEHATYREVAARSRTEARTADVIVMGNSRVMFGINCQELGRGLRLPGRQGGRLTVADLSAEAATPAADLWMWRQAASAPHPPRARLAVIGLAPLDFSRKLLGTDYGLRYLFGARDVLWLARDGRVNYAATLLTYRAMPLYAVDRSVTNMLLNQPQRYPMLFPPSRKADLAWLGQYKSWYSDYRIDPWQVRCLTQMAQEMRAHGVRVILLAPPVGESLLRLEAGMSPNAPMPGGSAPAGMPGSPLRLFRDMVKSFEARQGVTHIDYLRAAYARRFEFWDPVHLLPASAVAFTHDLTSRINAELARDEARAPL